MKSAHSRRRRDDMYDRLWLIGIYFAIASVPYVFLGVCWLRSKKDS